MEIDGKLNLDGAFHLVLSILQHLAHQFGQRKDVTLQDTCKRDDLAVASLVETIVNALVNGVVGGTNPLKCAVAFSLSDRHLDEVETIIHAYLASFLRTLCPQSEEISLGVAQSNLHFAHLQDLMRVGRTDAKACSAIHNVLAKAHCKRDGSFLGLLVADWIIVDASRHTTNDRVEAAIMFLSNNLLKDDGHLLLVNHITRGSHIVFAATIEDAGIYGFNRL